MLAHALLNELFNVFPFCFMLTGSKRKAILQWCRAGKDKQNALRRECTFKIEIVL